MTEGNSSDWPDPYERVRHDVPMERMATVRDVDIFLPVVCTDREQHKSTQLTTVTRELDGQRHMLRIFEAFAPPMGEGAASRTALGRDSYAFVCKRRGRTPSEA